MPHFQIFKIIYSFIPSFIYVFLSESMHTCVLVRASLYACGNQKRMSDVSFYVSLFFQVRGSLEVVFFSWAGSQQAPEMPPVSPRSPGWLQVLWMLSLLHKDWDPNSGPHDCSAAALYHRAISLAPASRLQRCQDLSKVGSLK